MKKVDVNFCSENGLALTQLLNLSIYFSLSPNITRIDFFSSVPHMYFILVAMYYVVNYLSF